MEIAKIKPTNYVYNKKQMIGKGSFGEVYMGYNEKDHHPVAVKIVSFEKIAHTMNKETLMSKLKQQIINMQIAQDQNLVQLFDAQSSSRNLYIICEYCNGQSFDSFLKRKGYLTQSQAMAFFKVRFSQMKQILKGFQNLHAKKIVHRDLKPANLLLHNYNIKIADLGFSKAIDQHQQLLQSIVGTPLYMSPQIFSREKYTQKTDIWSLGVILYEMLYGRIPWKAKSLIELKEKVWNQAIEFPVGQTITGATKHLIQSMLQRQENNRVGWQELFSRYIFANYTHEEMFEEENHTGNNEMIEESSEHEESFKKMFEYIDNSFYLESQCQLVKVLIDLGIRSKENIEHDSKFESAEDYFSFKKFTDEKKLEILSYCFNNFSRRNRIAYLFKIFEYVHQLAKHLQMSQNQHMVTAIASLISCQLLIIKFAIHSVQKLLTRQITNEQEKKINHIVEFGPSKYPNYIKLLLRHDLESFKQFYDIFMAQFFEPNIKILAEKRPDICNEINKQLGGLYKNQIGDYKFVKFMLTNALRSVFNEVKNIEPKTEIGLLITRSIFQFEKDKQLFELGDLLESYNPQKSSTIPILNTHDLHKKVNSWKGDEKWKQKLQEVSEMKIESLSSYINKQFKWNPLHVYAVDLEK